MTGLFDRFFYRQEAVLKFWKLVIELDTLLQYHLNIQEPEKLPIEMWAAKLACLRKIRQAEAKVKAKEYAGI